jgi:hypothetical protein
VARSREPVKTTVEPDPPNKRSMCLAENLAAAAVAIRLNGRLDYAKKNHMNQPLGEFCFYLARLVTTSSARKPPAMARIGGHTPTCRAKQRSDYLRVRLSDLLALRRGAAG